MTHSYTTSSLARRLTIMKCAEELAARHTAGEGCLQAEHKAGMHAACPAPAGQHTASFSAFCHTTASRLTHAHLQAERGAGRGGCQQRAGRLPPRSGRLLLLLAAADAAAGHGARALGRRARPRRRPGCGILVCTRLFEDAGLGSRVGACWPAATCPRRHAFVSRALL